MLKCKRIDPVRQGTFCLNFCMSKHNLKVIDLHQGNLNLVRIRSYCKVRVKPKPSDASEVTPSVYQGRSQEGLGPLQKNLNRNESTAQNFLEGVQTLLVYTVGCTLLVISRKKSKFCPGRWFVSPWSPTF